MYKQQYNSDNFFSIERYKWEGHYDNDSDIGYSFDCYSPIYGELIPNNEETIETSNFNEK
jgi:hypothetical protein